MTPTLTDADREAIAAIYGNDALYKAETPMGFHFYLAGLAAGMERAAKICANVANNAIHDAAHFSQDKAEGAEDCAAAIRASAKD